MPKKSPREASNSGSTGKYKIPKDPFPAANVKPLWAPKMPRQRINLDGGADSARAAAQKRMGWGK